MFLLGCIYYVLKIAFLFFGIVPILCLLLCFIHAIPQYFIALQCTNSTRIRSLFGDDLFWQFGKSRKDGQCKLTVYHYRAIYTASMGFFPCNTYTEIHQFKIPPILLHIWANCQILNLQIIPLTQYTCKVANGCIHTYVLLLHELFVTQQCFQIVRR